MVATSPQKSFRFDDFLALYGEDDPYELVDGEIFDLEPKGPHKEVAAFIDRKLNVQIDYLDLPYVVLQRGLLKPSGDMTAFRPDIMVLDKTVLVDEPFWTHQSVISLSRSIQFIAEVVSTNWQNDYARKMEDYAALGIPEYWIVDYAALGGERIIGQPKQPTLTLCHLIDGRYEDLRLQGRDRITSQVFPDLKLTAEQVLKSYL